MPSRVVGVPRDGYSSASSSASSERANERQASSGSARSDPRQRSPREIVRRQLVERAVSFAAPRGVSSSSAETFAAIESRPTSRCGMRPAARTNIARRRAAFSSPASTGFALDEPARERPPARSTESSSDPSSSSSLARIPAVTRLAFTASDLEPAFRHWNVPWRHSISALQRGQVSFTPAEPTSQLGHAVTLVTMTETVDAPSATPDPALDRRAPGRGRLRTERPRLQPGDRHATREVDLASVEEVDAAVAGGAGRRFPSGASLSLAKHAELFFRIRRAPPPRP